MEGYKLAADIIEEIIEKYCKTRMYSQEIVRKIINEKYCIDLNQKDMSYLTYELDNIWHTLKRSDIEVIVAKLPNGIKRKVDNAAKRTMDSSSPRFPVK